MKKGNAVKYGFISDSRVFNAFSNIHIKDSCLITFPEGFDRCYFGVQILGCRRSRPSIVVTARPTRQ